MTRLAMAAGLGWWVVSSARRLSGIERALRALSQANEASTAAVEAVHDELALQMPRHLDGVHRDLIERLDARTDGVVASVTAQVDGVRRELSFMLGVYTTLGPRLSLEPTTSWAASPKCLKSIVNSIVTKRPRVILECGSGASTIVSGLVARAFDVPCRIYSIEHLPQIASALRREVDVQGLQDIVTIVDAPLVEITEGLRWYDLSALGDPGPVDMLFVDGPPGDTNALARSPALSQLGERLAPEAVVILDDTNRADEAEILRRWADQFGVVITDISTEDDGVAVMTFPGSRVAR